MSDPISVRHVMASADITERITKTEAAHQQALSEEFAKELSRQDALKQSQVNKEEQKEKIRDERQKHERDEEEKRRKREAKTAEEGQDDGGIDAEGKSSHIIDLQV